MKNNKVLLVFAGLLMSLVTSCSLITPKERIMGEPHNFVKLTNKAGTSGGSGFAVIAPSGKVYTMTNSHVCDGVRDEEGYLYGQDAETDRSIRLKIIEVSNFTDLCLLEPMPKATGYEVSDHDAVRNDKLFVLGFPALEPLQFAEGLMTKEKMHTEVPLMNVKPEDCTQPKHVLRTFKFSFFGIEIPMEICMMSLDSALTNIKIYPGNSGSAVFNESGEITGVVYASDNRTTNAMIIRRIDIVRFLFVY